MSVEYRPPVWGVAKHDLRIANDSPGWFKKRRIVWFILHKGLTVTGPKGSNRYFATSHAASRLC